MNTKQNFWIGFIILLPLCGFGGKLEAQQELNLNLAKSCNYDGSPIKKKKLYGFASDKEAEEIIRNLLDKLGLEANFIIQAANVANASAIIEGEKRYILYSQRFMEKLKAQTKTDWASVGVLAHEIGHHLNGHTLVEKEEARPDQELTADIFSGHIMGKLGATLEEALSAVESLPEDSESDTHPPKDARIEAVTVGWKKGKEQKIPEEKNKPKEEKAEEPIPISPLNHAIQDAKLQIHQSFSEMIYGSIDHEAIRKFIVPFTTFKKEVEYPQGIVYLSGSLQKKCMIDAISDNVLNTSGKKISDIYHQELEKIYPAKIEVTAFASFRQNLDDIGYKYVKTISNYKEKSCFNLINYLKSSVDSAIPRLQSELNKKNINGEVFFKKAFLRSAIFIISDPNDTKISLTVKIGSNDWICSIMCLFLEYEIYLSQEEINSLKKFFSPASEENSIIYTFPEDKINISSTKNENPKIVEELWEVNAQQKLKDIPIDVLEKLSKNILNISHPSATFKDYSASIETQKSQILLKIKIEWEGTFNSYISIFEWKFDQKQHILASISSENSMFKIAESNRKILNAYFFNFYSELCKVMNGEKWENVFLPDQK